MRIHHGMRPQDIVVLLKIIILKGKPWQIRELAQALGISTSEISASLNRSQIAGLLDATKKKVNRQSFMDFLVYGVRFVFPAVPGTLVIGIPTAHSHPYYKNLFISEINYVWPSHDGHIRGLAIEPLHAGVPGAVKMDEVLYKLLASVDILRVGKNRERDVSIKILNQYIFWDKPENQV